MTNGIEQYTRGVNEELRSRNLETSRLQYQRNSEVKEHGGKFSPPSRLLYFPLIMLAGISDVWGIVGNILNLTAVLAIIVFLINGLISGFFFLTGMVIVGKLRKMQGAQTSIVQAANASQQRANMARQQTSSMASLIKRSGSRTNASARLSRMKRASNIAHNIAHPVDMVSRYIRRAAISVVAELIPFISLAPGYTINMVSAYRDHKKAYKAATTSLNSYYIVSKEEEGARAELQNIELLAQAAAIEEASEEEAA